jgi:hypothetical protein
MRSAFPELAKKCQQEVPRMSSQQNFAERTNRTAEGCGDFAADGHARHRCPFCRGVMVARKSDQRRAADDTLECTGCPTVIFFPPEFEAPALRRPNPTPT